MVYLGLIILANILYLSKNGYKFFVIIWIKIQWKAKAVNSIKYTSEEKLLLAMFGC